MVMRAGAHRIAVEPFRLGQQGPVAGALGLRFECAAQVRQAAAPLGAIVRAFGDGTAVPSDRFGQAVAGRLGLWLPGPRGGEVGQDRRPLGVVRRNAVRGFLQQRDGLGERAGRSGEPVLIEQGPGQVGLAHRPHIIIGARQRVALEAYGFGEIRLFAGAAEEHPQRGAQVRLAPGETGIAVGGGRQRGTEILDSIAERCEFAGLLVAAQQPPGAAIQFHGIRGGGPSCLRACSNRSRSKAGTTSGSAS